MEVKKNTNGRAYKPLGEILVEMGRCTEETLEKALDSRAARSVKFLLIRGRKRADIKKALEKQSQEFP